MCAGSVCYDYNGFKVKIDFFLIVYDRNFYSGCYCRNQATRERDSCQFCVGNICNSDCVYENCSEVCTPGNVGQEQLTKCQNCAQECPVKEEKEATAKISETYEEPGNNMEILEAEIDENNEDYSYNLRSWSRPHLRGKDLVPKCALTCAAVCERPVQSCAMCIHKTCKGI